MNERAFWFVDDEYRVRWAVHIREPFNSLDQVLSDDRWIIFTSRDRQISAPYPLRRPQHQLGRPELLELLARAKGKETTAESSLLALLAA